jgi:signal transduction histidine kinase
MDKLSNSKTELTVLRSYFWILLILWTVLVGSVLLWSLFRQQHETGQGARILARNSFEKDIIYRQWAASHGGVYVPITDSTPPNPYLSHIEERDITTSSGRVLTLVNPAYMTRQVHELGAERYGVRGHITSLNPIRPANAADEWETKALRAFEQGVKEVSSIEKIGNQDYMRLMRPMITEESCLKCHAGQGYKVGDLRGGISVSVPMAPIQAVAMGHALTLTVGHFVLWLLGVGGISFGGQRLEQHIQKRNYAEEQITNLAKFPSENPNPVLRVTKDGEILYSNEAGKSLLAKWGSKPREIVPEKWNKSIAQAFASKKSVEVVVEVKDKVFSIAIAPVKEAGYANLYGRDITEHKRVEEQIENLAKFPSENPNPVLRVARNGLLLFANNASSSFLAEWKCQEGEIMPENWRQTISEIFSTGSSKRVEIEHAGRTFAFMVVPILDAGYANLYARDITERKQAENELEKTNDELETRVQNRTRELAMTVEVLQSEVAERMRLQKEVLEISEEEQRRIGRELHDGIQQELVGMTFECQLLSKKLTAKSLSEADDVARLHRLLSDVIEHTRAITRMLYPIDLDSKDISFALKQLAFRIEGLFHISCQFTCKKALVVKSPEVAINIYRIVQEAITNAIKHGKADSISINLKSSQNRITFTIRDNGTGLAPDYDKTKGMGLRIMKYRASVIGASLNIRANTKSPGALVTCSVERREV